jgi:uncharacterized repeat protein (TIGR03803 family)
MKIARSVSLRFFLGMIAVCAALNIAANAQTESTIYTFSGTSGGRPAAALVFDKAGNLYGTTEANSYNLGTVFEISPVAGGGWNFTTIYNFQDNSTDGESPATNLLIDVAGNLYGATTAGGASSSCFGGCGTVFELSPSTSGVWTKTTLYSFGAVSTDATGPIGNIVMDAAGNIYGATAGGGSYGTGTVYKLSPQSGGGWIESVLHEFGKTPAVGLDPRGGVVLDKNGNLYGTLANGGVYNSICPQGCGTVFELSPNKNLWTIKLLHVFQGTDGAFPEGALTFDTAGNLYSTTWAGGKNSAGVVFKLTPKTGTGWQYSLLHVFDGKANGAQPFAGVLFDSKGNLYGTTAEGGKYIAACQGASGCGLVYQLTPSTSGQWSSKVLHYFTGTDGYYVANPLTLDSTGHLFGAAVLGGSPDQGTVFEIAP